MPGQDRAGEAHSIQRYLSQFTMGTVLVVGARPHTFPETIREHPKVIIWDSDRETANKDVPASVRVIICLRFITHAMFSRLQRHARKHHLLLMPGLNNSGEIKQMLSQALDLPADTPVPPPEPPPTPAPEPPPSVPYGIHKDMTTRELVRTFGDRSNLPMIAEARRLHALAQQGGMTCSISAIVQQVGLWHKQTAPPPTQTAPLDLQPPVSVPPPTPSDGADTRVSVALRLIDDLAAGLQLVREAVQRVGDDEKHTQATITALRKLLN
jgi:hypothetical protein